MTTALVATQVTTEIDPTPLVLSLARTLRESAEVDELRGLFATTSGPIALRSHVDAQSATLHFADGGVRVTRGLADGAPQVELHFSPEYTLGESSEPIAAIAAKLLAPPLPTWRDAAERLWTAGRDLPGFPSRLIVVCTDDDDRVTFGEGSDSYEIHGPAGVLATVLSGRTSSFLHAVGGGALTAVGSGAQMSVVCGAHWKVRFGA